MGGDGRSHGKESWKQLYEAALLEFDPLMLPQRIAQAQNAVAERASAVLRENGETSSEKEALANAHIALGDLKRIRSKGRVA